MTMMKDNKKYGGAYALPHWGIAGLHDPFLTLETDVSVKRRESAARLGERKHARRDFTAPEKLSFFSLWTARCFQGLVVQRVPYHLCGALGLDYSNFFGAVAFFLILFFGAFWDKKRKRYSKRTPQTERRRIFEHDHVRRSPYRMKGTRRLVHFENPLAGSPVKALVDDEFCDASERRVHWDVFENERTTSRGKAAPKFLRKNLIYSNSARIPIVERRLKNASDFEAFFGRVEALGDTVADALTLQLFCECSQSITLEPLVCSFRALRDNQDVLSEGLLETLFKGSDLDEPDVADVGDVADDESALDNSSVTNLDAIGAGSDAGGFGVHSVPSMAGEQDFQVSTELLVTAMSRDDEASANGDVTAVEELLEMLIIPDLDEPDVADVGDVADDESARELGTIWIPHPNFHGLVRRSARLASRPVR
jgi:hypothetical protein